MYFRKKPRTERKLRLEKAEHANTAGNYSADPGGRLLCRAQKSRKGKEEKDCYMYCRIIIRIFIVWQGNVRTPAAQDGRS